MEINTNTQKPIKALLCQLSPAYKDKQKNIERALISLQKYQQKDKIDIILFPQLIFTGYNFKNKEDALPLAVKQNQGEEFQFARMIALKLKTYVAFGYIQKVEISQYQIQLYNAAAVIDRDGLMVANYRKCHLYYNDKFWAAQGTHFVTFTLINSQNQPLQCSLAISSDINQKDFISGQYQIANYIVKTKTDVLLFLTNWVDSQKDKDTLHKNDIAATYSYWLTRLTPVVLSKRSLLFLAADRVGTEYDYFAKKQIIFFGSSAAIMLNPHKILSNLDIFKEEFLLIQTFLP